MRKGMLHVLSNDEAHVMLHFAADACRPTAPALSVVNKWMHGLWHADMHTRERLWVTMEPVYRDIRARCWQHDYTFCFDLEDVMSPEDWSEYAHSHTDGRVESEERSPVNTRSITHGLKYTGRHELFEIWSE